MNISSGVLCILSSPFLAVITILFGDTFPRAQTDITIPNFLVCTCCIIIYILFIYLDSNIDGITGFSEENSKSVLEFMKFAVDLANSVDGQVNIYL